MNAAIKRPEEYERIRANFLLEADPYYRELAIIHQRAAPRYFFAAAFAEFKQLPYEPTIQFRIDELNAKIKEIANEYFKELM